MDGMQLKIEFGAKNPVAQKACGARLLKRLRGVVGNYRRMIRTQRNLNVFQRAFSQLSLLIPTVLLAAEVLSGRMEVGRAIEAGGAFAAVLGAVSLIVDNFESLSRFAAGIVQRMEKGDLSLDESLAAYERGVGLYRRCQAALEQAELRVRLLADPLDPESAEPFGDVD